MDYVFYDVLNNRWPPCSSRRRERDRHRQLFIRQRRRLAPWRPHVDGDGNVTLVSDDVVDVTVITAGDLQITKSVPSGRADPGTSSPIHELSEPRYGLADVDRHSRRHARVHAVPRGSAAIGTPPASITGITAEYSNDACDVDLHACERRRRSAGELRRRCHARRFVLAGVLEPVVRHHRVSFVVRIVAE